MREFDVVHLKENDDEAGVKTSYLGTIVDVIAPGLFTVEFLDSEGETILPALMKTYTENQLIKET